MSEPGGPPSGPNEGDGRTSAGPAPVLPEPPVARPSESIRLGETSSFPAPKSVSREHAPLNPTGKRLAVLSLGALGVVFGDIGTSPLYAMQAAFSGKHAFEPTAVTVYGVLSM